MSKAEQVAEFGRTLSTAERSVELKRFPSGAAWLDVRFGDRLFILAYLPTHDMFGVDEVGPDDGLGTWFRHGFREFDEAREKLLELMRAPACVAAR
jgi:hypothetical protein